jgi:GMP reductase
MLYAFDYDDIQLIPQKCVVESRSECDTSIKFGNHIFKLPIVPANMRCVIDEEVAIWLATNGYFYIMHRFEVDSYKFVRTMCHRGLVPSISVGVKEEDYKLVKSFKGEGCQPYYVTIDIAHAHSDSVAKMIGHIKENIPDAFVIAGNVCTPDAVRFLEDAGADATKVGIGPGAACTTKLKTGFGSAGWQLAAVAECSREAKNPIVADGGVRHHADIAKAIVVGADMVMIGSMLAGFDESPGELIVMSDGRHVKEFYGSASEFNKGHRKNVEGRKLYVDYQGPIEDRFREITEDLQSSISYGGGRKLEDLRKVTYKVIR